MLIVLYIVGCGKAGPAVVAHPRILEKEARHVQRCPVLSGCPAVGGGREMTAPLLPRGQGGWTELFLFISEHVFSPPFLCLLCALLSLIKFFCSLFPPLTAENDKGSYSFKWQTSYFALYWYLVLTLNLSMKWSFPICSGRISPPDAKVADYVLKKCFVSGKRLETKRFRFGLGCSPCWNAVKCPSLSCARASSRHSFSHPASPAALLSVCVDH